MGSKRIYLSFIGLLCSLLLNAQKIDHEIIIVADIYAFPIAQKSSFNVDDFSAFNVFYGFTDSVRPEMVLTKGSMSGGKLKWTIKTQKPVIIASSPLFGPAYLSYPGDSVFVTYSNGKRIFTGKGAAKYQLKYEISVLKAAVQKPTKYVVDVKSLADYLKVSRYYDTQIDIVMSLIESYQHKISRQEYDWIKCNTIEWIEYGRLNAFQSFVSSYSADGLDSAYKYNFTYKDLCAIWDSTQYKPWVTWLRKQSNYHNGELPLYFYSFNRYEIWRRFNFNFKDDSLNSKPIRTYLYYENAKRNYSGVLRERVLAAMLDEQVIMEMGADHLMSKAILKDYYSLPGFASYKDWVRSLAKRSQYASEMWAPPFELVDQEGKKFSKAQLSGKIAVLDLWFTGCKGCVQMASSLRKVKEALKKDTNVVFVNISIDINRDQWIRSIKERKFVSGGGRQLFTAGMGANHPMIKQYDIRSYPTLLIIDPFGKMVNTNTAVDPRADTGKMLISVIQKQLLRLKDGPYIVYDKQAVHAFAINASTVHKKEVDHSTKLTVATDEYHKDFEVSLHKALSVPPSEYEKPDKLLVLSDIEGNFNAFRKLLQTNGVIDEDYNWTFGNGHLVFGGDMFDRGEQVPECLWLIYSLEEKAKEAGGFVHFILGNHELLNLQGNVKYVSEKYKRNAELLGKTISEIYSQHSELGRWLRTKNIAERIGDLLFIHGGISAHVNEISIGIDEINEVARPYYDKSKDKYLTRLVNLIMGLEGPLWYRGFYNEPKASLKQIDSTLNKFNVRHIITGHTIIADTITVHYDYKVINTDTKHATGNSEALLIEGLNYYRVNDKGKRQLLFNDQPFKLLSKAVK